tara:strand:- start:74 stop:535 length:462 start_codon:yes stop_codon:yes gene_type:complete
MALEIERKFLVNSDNYKLNAKSVEIKQAYLSIDKAMAIRVRIENIQASINIKSKKTERTNYEFEYVIPLDEARSLIGMSSYGVIEKTRFLAEYKDKIWEVDEFHGNNQGLIVAEIELDTEDESFDFPDWIGEEVTADFRYLNSNLAKSPFKSW